jgi:general secretion pathway protein G
MARMLGYTLTDLMITLTVAGLLAALAFPSYATYVERARIAKAVDDISSISVAIEQFELNNDGALPLDLKELPVDLPMDPWGRPYEYFNIRIAEPGKIDLRRDGKLGLLNTDFDLYSRGEDGHSSGPLSAKVSRDDIVRANNGGFIGIAEDY